MPMAPQTSFTIHSAQLGSITPERTTPVRNFRAIIPANLLNPVGQKIVNLFPLPNRPGTGPNDLNNYARKERLIF